MDTGGGGVECGLERWEDGRPPREVGGKPGKRGVGKPEEANVCWRRDQRGQRLDMAKKEDPDDRWV